MRDFKTASKHFLDTVATFTSYELMDYETFVIYTILCAMVALPRPELRDKVILLILNSIFTFYSLLEFYLQVTKGAEILETLHNLSDIRNYLFSLYECRYADFFVSLGKQFFSLLQKNYGSN
jgi:26S proteasome regulatory subunit N7